MLARAYEVEGTRRIVPIRLGTDLVDNGAEDTSVAVAELGAIGVGDLGIIVSRVPSATVWIQNAYIKVKRSVLSLEQGQETTAD
jgi:hypothetical protein